MNIVIVFIKILCKISDFILSSGYLKQNCKWQWILINTITIIKNVIIWIYLLMYWRNYFKLLSYLEINIQTIKLSNIQSFASSQ